MNLKLTIRAAAFAIVALLSATLLFACTSDDGDAEEATPTEAPAVTIAVTDAWARPTTDVEDPTSAIYAVIQNGGEADRLVSASVPAEIAGMVQTHTTETDGDTMKMVEVDGYEVPANGELVLEPGHHHIMLMMIPNPLAPGDMFTATFHFEHAGDIEVMVEVREMSGMSGMSMGN